MLDTSSLKITALKFCSLYLNIHIPVTLLYSYVAWQQLMLTFIGTMLTCKYIIIGIHTIYICD